jgi:hypothetical protein
MSDYCYCDYVPPSVCNDEMRKARKEHRCCACGRTIRAGEAYEHVWGIWDGEPSTYKTCSHCLALREYTKAHVPCFCWCYGSEGREEAMECLREYAHHAPGLWFAGARLYVQARQLRAAERRH